MSILCRLGWHGWSLWRWQHKFKIDKIKNTTEAIPVQVRYCGRCYIHQERST